MSVRRPAFDADLYSDAAIADPHPLYRAIRDLGAAVWLRAHDVWAIGRFQENNTLCGYRSFRASFR